MSNTLHDQFISKLEEQYGSLDKMTSKFGSATFGKVADDLCISASQFTKLIYGSATDGMYTRTIRNVDRLIKEDNLSQLLRDQNDRIADAQMLLGSNRLNTKTVLLSLLLFTLGAMSTWLLMRQPLAVEANTHPLNEYFDQDFNIAYNSPYLDISEVQEYCPCSAYEGTWTLNQTYKLPIPANGKPGLYYVGKSADVRMKCSKSDTLEVGTGRVLMGYEHLINEIWIDLGQSPLSPIYFDKDSKSFTPAFEKLTFENNEQFQKVATINSFFIDRFEIRDEYITRSGEPCGRFASDINTVLLDQYEIDLDYILKDVLGDLTQTVCENAINLYCDPNDLKEGESVIDFECQYTISNENLGLGGGYPYRKGYKLQKQNYAANLTCACDTQ